MPTAQSHLGEYVLIRVSMRALHTLQSEQEIGFAAFKIAELKANICACHILGILKPKQDMCFLKQHFISSSF